MAKMLATEAPKSFMILVAGAFDCRLREPKGASPHFPVIRGKVTWPLSERTFLNP
jgi:hypothetical protein